MNRQVQILVLSLVLVLGLNACSLSANQSLTLSEQENGKAAVLKFSRDFQILHRKLPAAQNAGS